MSGIAGILSGSQPLDQDELGRFTLALNHRGPDAYNTFRAGNIGLGQTELRLFESEQRGIPCYGGKLGNRYALVYDGEILNFLDVREELREAGASVTSYNPAEIIALAYERWGKDCLKKFCGSFSLGIWDKEEGSLFLARDRFGVKPLYYSTYGRRLTFASELKAFSALDNFPCEINSLLVPRFLNLEQRSALSEETIFKGVRALLPGHYLTLNAAGSMGVKSWWNLSDSISDVPGRFSMQVARFKELLFEALRLCMRTDKPTCSCLSGGLDSAAMVCALTQFCAGSPADLAHFYPNWQRAFILAVSGTKMDERAQAAAVCKQAGLHLVQCTLGADEALSALIDCIWSMDEPCLDWPLVHWALFRTLKANDMRVALCGFGVGQLLGGQPHHLDCKGNELLALLKREIQVLVWPEALRRFERCSMAHGIELRLPYLDHRLVGYCLGLPPDSKMGQGHTKRILREAFKEILPHQVLERQCKVEFETPPRLFINPLFPSLVERIVEHRVWLQNPYFDGVALAPSVLAQCLNVSKGQEELCNIRETMALLSFTLWQMLYVERCIGEIQ